MDAEAWVRILYTYGPFAILVFLVFVTERKLRAGLKEASEAGRRTHTILYVLNWAAIFGLVIFSVYVWKQMNLDRMRFLSGRIENVHAGESIGSSSDDLYLRRRPVGDVRSTVYWVLPRDRAFAEGEVMTFTISAKDKAEVDFDLPMSLAFYDTNVVLKRIEGKLYFQDRFGKKTELQGTVKPLLSEQTPPPHSWLYSLVPSAHAQDKVNAVSDFGVALDSSDANVRRYARRELAKLGEAALPWIEQVLTDPASSYQLRLGVIVALNNMAGLRSEALNPSTRNAIVLAGSDKDPTIKSQAYEIRRKFGLSGTVVPLPVTIFEHADFTGKSQGFSVGNYQAKRGQFGKLPNDSASSLRIDHGYRTRLCDSEGTGNGSGICFEFGSGARVISRNLKDRVSYIEVKRL